MKKKYNRKKSISISYSEHGLSDLDEAAEKLNLDRSNAIEHFTNIGISNHDFLKRQFKQSQTEHEFFEKKIKNMEAILNWHMTLMQVIFREYICKNDKERYDQLFINLFEFSKLKKIMGFEDLKRIINHIESNENKDNDNDIKSSSDTPKKTSFFSRKK